MLKMRVKAKSQGTNQMVLRTLFSCARRFRACLGVEPRTQTSRLIRPGCWHVLALALLFMATTRSGATTYTVKASGGGNYTTIQACANAAIAGDTCVVYAGTYNENVTPRNSGTLGSPITFKSNAGDTVNVNAFTVSSRAYITIGGSGSTEGFVICQTYTSAACIQMGISNHIVIQNNVIAGTSTGGGGSTACIANSFGSANDSSYVSILHNTIAWCAPMGNPSVLNPLGTGYQDPTKKAGASALYLRGNHWLIDGNDFEHVTDFISNSGGYYNVIRNNTMQNVDCLADFGLNNECHIDVLELTCNTSISPLGYTLFERNVAKNIYATGPADGRGVHGMLAQSACPTGVTRIIVRFNIYNNITNIFVQGDTTQGGVVDRLKTYNNTFSNNQIKSYYASLFTGQNLNASSINNLYYNDFGTTTQGIGIALDSTSVGSFTGNNDLFYGVGTTWSGFALAEPGHVIADPLLTSATDVHLLQNSPAIGAGTYLTTVASSDTGLGTSLVVNEAAFFQDGLGIPGVQGDWIRLGTSTIVQITSVNYGTNTLTLSSSVTRSPGTPVYLFKVSDGTTVLYGNSPDIGALPFTAQPPSPPSNLSVSVT